MTIRRIAALFVTAHGLGYVIWFLAAWFPSALGPAAQIDTGGFAKAFGLIAILVVAGFAMSAWGIWHQAEWWATALVVSLIGAIPIAAFVWSPVGNVSVMAELANAGLVAATVSPWGDAFFGAHR